MSSNNLARYLTAQNPAPAARRRRRLTLVEIAERVFIILLLTGILPGALYTLVCWAAGVTPLP